MTLGRAARGQLDELILTANPLEGFFFRSVAFQYFHPDDVVSGEGTRAHGGRFAPVGIAAVYGSAEEDTALREAAARQTSLRGRSKTEFRDYPRLTYILEIKTERNLDLSTTLPAELHNVIEDCVQPHDHILSQNLAEIWIAEGIQSILFPSATGTGRNVAVYIGNASPESVAVFNRAEILVQLRQRLL